MITIENIIENYTNISKLPFKIPFEISFFSKISVKRGKTSSVKKINDLHNGLLLYF